MKIQRITYISLGSNQGDKLENLQKAIGLIADKVGSIQKIASVYKTEAVGFTGDEFYNTVIKVSTYLPPEILIQTLLAIENDLGRTRLKNGEYSNRSIDLDVLLFDDEIIFSKTFIVPHPRMLER